MPRVLSIAVGLLTILGALALLGWLMARSLKRSDDPTKLVVKWIATFLVGGALVVVLGGWGPSVGSAIVMPITCVLFGIILTFIWAPSIGTMLSRPLTSMFDGGFEEAEPEPLYSIAQAKRKKGQFREAIWEIQQQLEKFPQDCTGQMLMAEIQAENLNDLQGAAVTIARLCQQTGHPPFVVADALNRLADWHLKFEQNPTSARQVLEQVVALLPDTQWAYAAHQRLAHLGGADMLITAHDRRPLTLAHTDQEVGLHKGQAPPPPEASPVNEAEKLVTHLEEFPLDNDAREQLAIIYARHYERLDLAAAELEQLLDQANAPAKMIVHWLNLLTDLHLQIANDEESARQTLQRINDLFPTQAAAELARSRQAHLKMEMKKSEATRIVKLGTYEQDAGLKMSRGNTGGNSPSERTPPPTASAN